MFCNGRPVVIPRRLLELLRDVLVRVQHLMFRLAVRLVQGVHQELQQVCDLLSLATRFRLTLAGHIRLGTSVRSVKCSDGYGDKYVVEYEDSTTKRSFVVAKQVVLCVNRRLGTPRRITLKNEQKFQGALCYGMGNQVHDVVFTGKRVLVIGGGAFAVENARTAIEKGASEVVVLSRRRGTVMPHLMDYLFYIRPFSKDFKHDPAGSGRSFAAWQAAFKSCGVTPPECWEEGRIAPTGHPYSVQDLWMVAHHYGLLSTR